MTDWLQKSTTEKYCSWPSIQNLSGWWRLKLMKLGIRKTRILRLGPPSRILNLSFYLVLGTRWFKRKSFGFNNFMTTWRRLSFIVQIKSSNCCCRNASGYRWNCSRDCYAFEKSLERRNLRVKWKRVRKWRIHTDTESKSTATLRNRSWRCVGKVE